MAPSLAAIDLVRRRVEELDRRPLPIVGSDAGSMLVRVASVLGSCTNTSIRSHSEKPLLAAADADETIETSSFLDVFADHDVGLVRGPLPRERQQWIATGRHRISEKETPVPSRVQFEAAYEAAGQPPSAKPVGVALFTSTAMRGGPSSWRTILELSRGSSLYPLPWYVWDLKVRTDAFVHEITSAQDWVAFVDAFATVDAGLVYPDWRRAMRQFDGVHLTLTAIAAVQGFSFLTSAGPTAPAFWDVESTLWLRWAFDETRLSQIVAPDSDEAAAASCEPCRAAKET